MSALDGMYQEVILDHAKRRSGELEAGQQVVVTVTGHGLKDIDTALAGRGPVRAEVVAPDLMAVAGVCGLLT